MGTELCIKEGHICEYCVTQEEHPDGFCVCVTCGARIKVGWREDERDERMDDVEFILEALSRDMLKRRRGEPPTLDSFSSIDRQFTQAYMRIVERRQKREEKTE